MFVFNKTITQLVVATSLIFTVVACNQTEETNQQEQASKTPPLPIEVAQVAYKPVQSWFTYSTRLEAPEKIALRPRVSGVINSVEFTEGQQVKQGQLLFTLDPRPFEAQVAHLKAELASAQAAFEQATNEAERAQRLRSRNAISAEEAEARTTSVKQSEAHIEAIKAQLATAQLNLDFSQVRSPIDGIISRAEITKGNTVNANQSVLTNIVSNEKMYAYFDVDERTWNQHFGQQAYHSGLSVVMQLLGNEVFAHQGKVDFIDNQINPSTGTLRVRAVFSQQDADLRSGAFARIKIAGSKAEQQVLIPEKALGTDLKNRFVLVVDEHNVLQYRPVTLGDRYGEFRAIKSGLKPQDNIAVNGPARVFPGMPVAPQMIQLDTSQIALTLGDFSPVNASDQTVLTAQAQ
ncbi:lipoprotein component of a efflux transporter [Catenovulum agarivorans DS-2]|uniref:Lipoprotein component of a efflux transporter n=1 Tax=Catenovulum agarivorans DS-2 TaxID=1328313 RepID=W7QUA6_9ALTE|nr:efflux RND transporter periplasmic adaptor subunit [Catenovulum agarivorans]EWH11428.1 lipoprotein component of a efflux transporter [Catenovulum agarivorans DS-2]